jgi:uncharacterized membrane protein YfhO
LNGEEYAPAQVLEESPEQKKLSLTRNTPGFLVTSLSNYPGWKFKVNGVETPVIRTNYAFMGIPVPAGTSEIQISYEPFSFKLGLAISAISLLALLLLVAFGLWFYRNSTKNN